MRRVVPMLGDDSSYMRWRVLGDESSYMRWRVLGDGIVPT